MKLKRIVFKFPQKHEGSRTFLQPLAIGSACGVFIALVLTMGIMDLRRSERSLIGLIEKQGLAISEVLQKLTQENLDIIVRYTQEKEEKYIPQMDDVLHPQKWLTTEIAEIAKMIDERWLKNNLSDEYLRKIAADNALWLVATLNREGKAVFKSRSLPKELLNGGTSEITIAALADLYQKKKIGGFIGLQRKDGSGMVVIAMDKEGLLFWGLKAAVKKALEKLGEGQKQGLIYVMVMNKKGMRLGSMGVIPEKWHPQEMPIYELVAGMKKWASRKVIYLEKPVLDMAVPLYTGGKVAGIIRLGLDREGADAILKENAYNLIIFMIFVVFITLFSMWLLYHNQNKHMAGIVEMERQLEKAERLSSLGKLAAGVAHEIRNPLNAISMASQRLKREFVPLDDAKKEEFLMLSGVIKDEIRRLNGIIEEFLSFSRTRKLELRPYPLGDVLQKIVNLLGEEAKAKGITIKTNYDGSSFVIPMDVDKLMQAFLNLIKNAMESINSGGKISISVERRERDRVAVVISDTGCGMSYEELGRIFSPEYTTKEKGLGLGLPLAYEIIRGHGGEISVTSEKEKGSTFEIILPLERRHT